MIFSLKLLLFFNVGKSFPPNLSNNHLPLSCQEISHFLFRFKAFNCKINKQVYFLLAESPVFVFPYWSVTHHHRKCVCTYGNNLPLERKAKSEPTRAQICLTFDRSIVGEHVRWLCVSKSSVGHTFVDYWLSLIFISTDHFNWPPSSTGGTQPLVFRRDLFSAYFMHHFLLSA